MRVSLLICGSSLRQRLPLHHFIICKLIVLPHYPQVSLPLRKVSELRALCATFVITSIPKTRSGREFSQFDLTPMGLATKRSISAALERTIMLEDEQWLSNVPASCQPLHPDSNPPFPRRGVSIESITDLAAMRSDTTPNPLNPLQEPPSPTPLAGELPSEDGGGQGSRKQKRPLTEARLRAKCAHNKKQRASEKGKEAKRERRQRKRQDRPPTERQPRCNKADRAPQGIPTNIAPLSHFPTVSTGYTGDKYVEDILDKEVWTLEKLKAHGLEIFEWDGK
jgi:hypothetical protein